MSTVAEEALSFGTRLRLAREERGLTLVEAANEAQKHYYGGRSLGPGYGNRSGGLSYERIRSHETGKVPEQGADPAVVLALAMAYQMPVSELSPVAYDRIRQMATAVLTTTRSKQTGFVGESHMPSLVDTLFPELSTLCVVNH